MKTFVRTHAKLPVKTPCPSCSKLIEGVTGVGIDRPAPDRITGGFTMCAYCGALLRFTDERGGLRMLREDERIEALRIHPTLQKVINDWRRKHTPNFARKTQL